MVKQVSPPDLRDVNITSFDGREVAFAEFCATCSTVPFLAEKRLVVVRGLLSRFERRPGTDTGARDRQGAAEWEGWASTCPPCRRLPTWCSPTDASAPETLC